MVKTSRAFSGRGIAVAAGALVIAAYLAHAAYYWPQINDDAFITFRYSRFLSLGLGPYFNVGEHVEGYTNPLMMLWMAAVIAVSGPTGILAVAKATGVACGLAAVVFTWLLGATWLRRIPALSPHSAALAWLAPALVAIQSGFALNSTTGLETAMFAAWIAGGLWLAEKAEQDGRWRGAGVLFALAALTRPEGAAAFAVFWVARLATGGSWDATARRRLLVDAAIVASTVAALLTARAVFYDGELLPNTYYAKTGGMGLQTPPSRYLAEFARRHLAYMGWVLSLLPLLSKRREIRRAAAPATAVLGFAVLAIFAAGPDWMPGYRLLAPYVPVWAALSVLGVFVVALERLGVRRRMVPAGACVLVLVALFLAQTPVREKYRHDLLIRARGYENGHEALAGWLQERSAPGDTIALMDIGIVGFRRVDRKILDITGLTDRTIAKSPGGFLDKRFDPRYVFDHPPRYLVIAWAGPEVLDAVSADRLVPWSPVERRLVVAPEFQRIYVRPRPAPEGADALDRIAARLGAERVFRHDYPGRSYLLAAYRRGE